MVILLAFCIAVPSPAFATEVVAFEDTILYPVPREGGMVYRFEGDGEVRRQCEQGERRMDFMPGSAAVHVAQYDQPALRVNLRIDAGVPEIAIAHNGMIDRHGHPNPSPGVGVRLHPTHTSVVDLATGEETARIDVALPRGRSTELTIAWDMDERWVRLDLPGGSHQVPMPASVYRAGGFGLRAPSSPATRFSVTSVQALWQDARDLVLYDGYDTVLDLKGAPMWRLPQVALPEGFTHYATCAVDLRRERTLIVFGGADINSDRPETLKGFAVRDLQTGNLLHVFGPTINGCLPLQGGGSLDGHWMLQSWLPPASTCWLDWNAFDRGDLEGFVQPAITAEVFEGGFVACHDPSNALDGSIARYLRVPETFVSTNHFTVHPALQAFAPFDDVVMPSPTLPEITHTGPAGMPSQLAVRDRDRAWYEQWALGEGRHVQSRGFDVFSMEDDWASPLLHASPRGGVGEVIPPYADYVNYVPHLTEPGKLFAQRAVFTPQPAGLARVALPAVFLLHPSPRQFVAECPLRVEIAWAAPIQMLMRRP